MELNVEYKKCPKCKGLETKKIEMNKSNIKITSSYCRTCGRTTFKEGDKSIQIRGGYGAYQIGFTDTELMQYGAFQKNISKSELNSKIPLIMGEPLLDIKNTFITYLDKKGNIELIMGTMPLTYDELKKQEEIAYQNNEMFVRTEQVDALLDDLKKGLVPINEK